MHKIFSLSMFWWNSGYKLCDLGNTTKYILCDKQDSVHLRRPFACVTRRASTRNVACISNTHRVITIQWYTDIIGTFCRYISNIKFTLDDHLSVSLVENQTNNVPRISNTHQMITLLWYTYTTGTFCHYISNIQSTLDDHLRVSLVDHQ